MRLCKTVSTIGALLATAPVLAATFPDVGTASPAVALVELGVNSPDWTKLSGSPDSAHANGVF
jgi:hypothetical protein